MGPSLETDLDFSDTKNPNIFCEDYVKKNK